MPYQKYYPITFHTHFDFKAYFGGLAECLGELNDHDPTELVCGGCSAKDKVQVCDLKMSRFMRKPAICICENKGADQLRGNREADHYREADQRLYFRLTESTTPLLLKSKISSI